MSAGAPRLVITGPTGVGKSTVAAEVAALLGMPLVDTDAVIEAEDGRRVRDIFAADGEAHFRALERAAVRAAARRDGIVVATGGGTVLDEDSFAELAGGAVVVVLACSAAETARRLRHEAALRPILSGDPATLEARIAALHDSRAERHAAAGPRIDTTGRTSTEVAAEIARRYRAALPDTARSGAVSGAPERSET